MGIVVCEFGGIFIYFFRRYFLKVDFGLGSLCFVLGVGFGFVC